MTSRMKLTANSMFQNNDFICVTFKVNGMKYLWGFVVVVFFELPTCQRGSLDITLF